MQYVFNQSYYLDAKTAQLNSVGQEAPGGGAWTAAKTLEAIQAAGMTPEQHYNLFGAYEQDAQGAFIILLFRNESYRKRVHHNAGRCRYGYRNER